MARENLWFAASTLESLRSREPAKYRVVVDRTKLKESEIDVWRRAADQMYVPYDETLGVHLQDEGFLDRKPWDFEGTPADKYPLLLHHHPLVIYRHQVIKQADVVLAMFLLSHEFTREQKKRNFDFYDPLTTGDSSLSVSIQGIVAGELGYGDIASRYAVYTAMMDLGDVGRNVRDGCHVASMGGTWMAVAYGLAGLRDSDGRIRFTPRRPARIDCLRFRITIRGQLLEISLGEDAVQYRLVEGEEVSFLHGEEPVHLSADAPMVEKQYAAGSAE
jgi:alpha,alpha-trehalose phosphorylase